MGYGKTVYRSPVASSGYFPRIGRRPLVFLVEVLGGRCSLLELVCFGLCLGVVIVPQALAMESLQLMLGQSGLPC